jgi:acyl transferase domain-containing protein/phosphopantetheinyl transferase (holo-ACP synthase)
MSRKATSPEPDTGPTPIAIIGMACMFSQAPDLRTFWNNICGGVDAIGEPVPHWDAQRYLDSGRIKTQFGGYLKDLYRFDPREFGIMPNSMDGGEPDQFLALRVARDALADAGCLGLEHDHSDTGVILGHSTYLHRGQVTVIQTDIVIDQTLEVLRATTPGLSEEALTEVRRLLQKKIPPMNADTAPGLVPNVMTGRIANRLNLKGPNYLVDAACSSSLLAVGAAIDELRAGRSRMMLAGGVNASLPADVTTIFTQLGALSARGKVRPFEAGSDGTLLGEGLGVVVLKRLPDALADGDRIYAVLRGIGQSSDGRGAGLLAPSQEGETLAIRRTYEASGVDPASIGLVEAHGTGIPLGDRTEIASLKAVFGARQAPIGTKALGSVKSMISHCIPAAGIASLIKMALSLHHRVLPPTLCDHVNPELGIDGTPFYINTQLAPWPVRTGQPRRAAVNAFGFGGTNSHAIVEQAPAQAARPPRLTDWPAELCLVSAASSAALVERLESLADGIAAHPEWKLPEVAAALLRADRGEPHRLAIVATDLAGLARSIAQAVKRLTEAPKGPKADAAAWATRGGVAYSRERVQGKLGFVFPGEGSQYPGMFADLAMCFDPVQQWVDFWHGLYGLPSGETRTDIVFPSSEVGAERRKQLEQRMHDMDVGSESVFIGGMAMHELLLSLGVEPDVMMGHSSGESAALGASGANPAVTPEDRAACIARHYAVYEGLLAEGKIPTGALLAVGALPPAVVEEQIEAAGGGEVVVAMDNCSNQIVLYGSPAAIERMQKSLAPLGGICLPLPFDRGYHTPAFADVSKAFLQYYKDVKVGRPKVPLYSCASAALFPETPAAVRQLAAAQWSQKVRFRETVLRMHDDGVRIFLEVGPSANLTAFVNDILIDRDYLALPSNIRRKGGVEQVLTVLGQLWLAGRRPALERLFEGRAIEVLDLAAAAPAPRGVALDNTMPMVRLTEVDRARLRALAAPLVAERAPSAAAPMVPPDILQPPADVQSPPEAAAADGRDAVMAGHFDLMRNFLDRQVEMVRALPHEALEATSAVEPLAISPVPLPPPDWPSTHDRDGRMPLLDELIQHDPGHRVHARCRVSLLNDRFIRDHVMSGPVSEYDPAQFGLSCVPFTVSLELMAEACALLAGRHDVRVIQNVKAYDWVALDDGALEIEVHAELLDAANGLYGARVVTARGTALAAEFGFRADWQLKGVAPLAELRPSCLNSPHLYATGMFHGPVFQSMTWVEGWDDSGIDVQLSPCSLDGFFALGQRPRLVLNPVLLDAMGQVVACWLVQYVGTDFHAFPSTIARLELYETCPDEVQGLVMRMRQRPADGVSTSVHAPRMWAFDCVDGNGRVLMRGYDLLNLFFVVPPAYHELRCDPLRGWLGTAAGDLSPPGSAVALWQVPLMAEEFCAQSGAICLRIMAHALLAASERDEWRALASAPLRRRREWLFGRAALKEAARAWIYAQTGRLLYPADIVVGHDALGAPFVDGPWCDEGIPAPDLSLSHNDLLAMAAVAGPGQSLGLDFEAMGRGHRPELLAGALAPQEHLWLSGTEGQENEEKLLRLWCAKEAAAKCLGIGLQGRPEAFVIEEADDSLSNLVVVHEQGVCEVRVAREQSTIIAIAQLGSIEVEG